MDDCCLHGLLCLLLHWKLLPRMVMNFFSKQCTWLLIHPQMLQCNAQMGHLPKTLEKKSQVKNKTDFALSCRYTLIPTSIILGLGGSPLWSAKCTYLTIAGNVQAAREGKKGSDVINQYFGIFFFIFQSSAVWGNLMSSLIFGQDTKIGRKSGGMLGAAVFKTDHFNGLVQNAE